MQSQPFQSQAEQSHPVQTQHERLAAAAAALAAAERQAGRGASERPAVAIPAPARSSSAHTRPSSAPGHEMAQAGNEPITEDMARAIVLRQLAMGPRSRKQLEDKLRQRSCPDHLTAAILDRMAEVGLVDDQAFAQMLVRSRQAGRGLAKRALAQELRIKGVDDEIVEETLGSIDPQSERSRAEELAARKVRTMAGLDPTVQARRLSGMLARKGYPPSVIYSVVRSTINDAPEHRRD